MYAANVMPMPIGMAVRPTKRKHFSFLRLVVLSIIWLAVTIVMPFLVGWKIAMKGRPILDSIRCIMGGYARPIVAIRLAGWLIVGGLAAIGIAITGLNDSITAPMPASPVLLWISLGWTICSLVAWLTMLYLAGPQAREAIARYE